MRYALRILCKNHSWWRKLSEGTETGFELTVEIITTDDAVNYFSRNELMHYRFDFFRIQFY